jgi:hypothetical protein
VVLLQVSRDAGVTHQPRQVSSSQHDIEVVRSIGFLDQPKLPIKARRLPLHQAELLVRYASRLEAPFARRELRFGRRGQQGSSIADGVVIGLAAVRSAEFIILSITQSMQKKA